jgi:hypothetical protein
VPATFHQCYYCVQIVEIQLLSRFFPPFFLASREDTPRFAQRVQIVVHRPWLRYTGGAHIYMSRNQLDHSEASE